MIQPLFVFSEWALLIIRVALGIILIAHGYSKFKNPQGTSEWLASLGFKPAGFWARLATAVELVGGAFLVMGLLTQVAAFFILGQFIVVLFKIKKFKKLVDGYEFDLLIAATALLLLFSGPGIISIDEALGIVLY